MSSVAHGQHSPMFSFMTFPELKVLFTNFICNSFSHFISNKWQPFPVFVFLLFICSPPHPLLPVHFSGNVLCHNTAMVEHGCAPWPQQLERRWTMKKWILRIGTWTRFFCIWCSNIFRHSWALWFGIWNVSIGLHSYLYSLKHYFSVGHYRLWGQTDGIAPSTPRFILNPWVLSASKTVLVIPCFQKSPWCAWQTVRPKKPKFWSRECFIAGPCKETSDWCRKSSELLTDSARCIDIWNGNITLLIKVPIVKAMGFPVVMCGCESWTIKKAEHRRIDAFKLWCWRRLLTVHWTARKSNQSVLKEISPEYSLEGLMLKLQSFGYLMQRTDSLEDSDAEKDWRQERKGMTEDEMVEWHQWLNGHEFEQAPGVGDGKGSLACGSPRGCRVRHD